MRHPKKVLTVRAIEALKPARAGKSYIAWDGGQDHLGLKVTDTGGKFWLAVGRCNGKQVWRRLGAYGTEPPAVTLAQARDKAQAIVTLFAAGKTPEDIEAEQRQKAAEAAARQSTDTVATAILDFIADKEADGALRRLKQLAGTLRRDFLGQRVKLSRITDTDGRARWQSEWVDDPKQPVWRDRPVVSISKRDILARVDEIRRQRGKYAGRHALAAIRRFFNWVADREKYGITESPAATLSDKKVLGMKAKQLRRKRVLDDGELCDVWHAAGDIGYPYGPLVRLLMLKAQRLSDIALASKPEVNLGAKLLTIPPERFKSDAAHLVPLAPLAVEIIEALPKFSGPFLFTTTAGKRPFSGFDKCKKRLDALIAERRKRENRAPMPHWTHHDLRRTVRTRLVSDCGIDSYIAERILGHSLKDLDAVYDQGVHVQPKRQGLEAWAATLHRIVNPPPEGPSNVVTMATERHRAG